MRIYGLDPPDKTTHQPGEQKPGQQALPAARITLTTVTDTVSYYTLITF